MTGLVMVMGASDGKRLARIAIARPSRAHPAHTHHAKWHIVEYVVYSIRLKLQQFELRKDYGTA